MSLLLVTVGGAAGVLSRYGLGILFPSLWTVVVINLAGSFVLGLLVHVGSGLGHDLRNALGVGFLGGFTTFSTLTVQTVLEADGGREGLAAIYLVVTVIGGLLAAIAGYLLGRVLA